MNLELFERERPAHDREASQWFTPAWLAKRLVSWCGNRVSPGMEGRPRVGKRAASVTPPEFLDVLVTMARSAERRAA